MAKKPKGKDLNSYGSGGYTGDKMVEDAACGNYVSEKIKDAGVDANIGVSIGHKEGAE